MFRLPHYYDGVTFLIFGTYHMFALTNSYLKSRVKNAKPFQAVTYYPQSMWGRQIPWECYIKFLLPFLGAVGEYFTIDPRSYNDPRLEAGGVEYEKMIAHMHYQHITMFLTFSLVGLFELLDFYYRTNFPPNFLYMMYSLALAVEGVVFYWHYPQGKQPVVSELHMMEVYVISWTWAVGLIEMFYREQILPALCVRYLLCLQGWWFMFADTVTDPQPWMWQWDTTDTWSMMTLSNYFALTIVFTLFYCLCIWLYCCWRHGQLWLPEEPNEKRTIVLDEDASYAEPLSSASVSKFNAGKCKLELYDELFE